MAQVTPMIATVTTVMESPFIQASTASISTTIPSSATSAPPTVNIARVGPISSQQNEIYGTFYVQLFALCFDRKDGEVWRLSH